MKHEGDEGEPTTLVLTRIHERRDHPLHLGRGLVPNQAAGAVEDMLFAEWIDLGLDLLDTSAEPRGEALHVDNGTAVSLEEDEDVPRKQGAHVTLDELCDVGAKDPVQVVHSQTIPHVEVRVQATRNTPAERHISGR